MTTITEEATEGAPVETVTIPKAALDWLMGESPDPGGLWFGDFPEDHPQPTGKFWWRRTFHEICLYYAPRMIRSALVAPQAEGRDTGLREALQKLRSYNVDIAAGRINYRPEDHIAVVDGALSTKEPE